MTCDEVRELLALLSLDALVHVERVAVEAHLATCSECARELTGYQETAATLALALPQVEPPAGLKRRILAAANADRGASRPTWWRRLGTQWPRALALVAALALIVALGAVAWAWGLQVQLAEQRAIAARNEGRAREYDRIVAILQGAQVHVRPLEGTAAAPGAAGRVYIDPASGDGLMLVRALPPPPEGRAYQLWAVRADGQRASCGLLSDTDGDGNGTTPIRVPTPLHEWQGLGVTEEPAGGSPGPTGARMLAGAM